MKFDKRIISSHYQKAKTLKEEIYPTLNEVLKYTDVTYQIVDGQRTTPAFREIEPIISSSITSLVNFIMSQLFSRGSNWASITVNNTLYKSQAGSQSDLLSESEIRKINEQLEKNTDIVFEYINSSNYYTEIAKAVRDSMVLGTGCYVIREQNSTTKPFSYEYKSMDNLYFLEDPYGKPHYVFNMIYGVNRLTLEDKYGNLDIKIPDDLQDDETGITKTVDIVECVIPEFDEHTATTIYNYYVCTSNFENVILERQLNYNPYVIFRWNMESGLIYGIGLGIKALKTFKDLEDYKTRRAKQADKIIDPPVKAIGDKSLIHQVRLEPGYVNYGGTGTNAELQINTDTFDIQPILTTQSLMPIDSDIQKAENDIRDIFLSNPLGNNTDYKGRTATETQARMELFRQRWSGSFELLQQELLEPTLITPFIIMVEKSLLVFDIENFEYTNIKYINELSRYAEIEKVERVSQYITNTYNASQICEAVGLKKQALVPYYAKSFRVPLELQFTEEEINQMAEQQRQMVMQLMAQQQLAQQEQTINNEGQMVE